ncbi:MAG TPA: hypothetical protein VK897_25590 [Anaerolineales bacterium]|nr:hypothetical protein [Anaerolineales bacterium]
MQISKLAKNMLRYLPVLAVLVATVLGLLLGEGLYPPSLDSQLETVAQLPGGSSNPQSLIIPATTDTCMTGMIFTSLPPKCKTLDGNFILANGTSPYVIAIPEGK